MDPQFLIPRGLRFLVWFEGENGGGSGAGAASSGGAAGSSAGTQNTDTTGGGGSESGTGGQGAAKPPDQAIPKARFDEVNTALRDTKAELDRIKNERQQQQDEE